MCPPPPLSLGFLIYPGPSLSIIEPLTCIMTWIGLSVDLLVVAVCCLVFFRHDMHVFPKTKKRN